MSKRYIIKFKNIQDFKQYIEGTEDMYPCIIQVPTPAGIAVGYSYDDSTFDIYIHKYLISTDSLHTMDLSSATTVDAVAVQDIIEQWQEGDRMTFSHDVVLYLKGELILGEYAHWEGDTLVYGDGRGTPYYHNYYYGYYDYYDYSYDYQEDWDEIDDTDDGQPVDLGLPSGTKWMKSNIGATKPSGLGKFYQWGDTQGYEGVDKHRFNWTDYKYGTSSSLTKYNNTDRLTLLESSDDSAAAATSGGTSMPTQDQLEELINNTEHRWLSLANGVNGMKFWKKGMEEPTDGNSYIFIPAAGNCDNGRLYDVGSWGYVWSASRSESNANFAWYMYFSAGNVGMNYYFRCVGYSVRAVVAKNI